MMPLKNEKGMRQMYYVPYTYPYPYYSNGHTFDKRSNNEPIFHPQVVSESLLERIKEKASAIDLYSRLVQIATDQQQTNHIRHVLEDEQAHLQQLTNQYIRLTGINPYYNLERIPFQTYQEGLQRAYEVKMKAYEDYRNGYLFSQPSPTRDLFLRAFNDQAVHVQQLYELLTKRNDYGGEPFVVNIKEATTENNNYRTALWTGDYFQVTLVSLHEGEDIGLEMHPDVDQFLRIEQGQGIVQMGDQQDQLNFEEEFFDDFAIVIPAGKWHNLTNTGEVPLKLYSIYAPPQHPFGTVHETKAEAMATQHNH
jgi:mannose-6-phosphate isomerase-like protein (cupin superfamily)